MVRHPTQPEAGPDRAGLDDVFASPVGLGLTVILVLLVALKAHREELWLVRALPRVRRLPTPNTTQVHSPRLRPRPVTRGVWAWPFGSSAAGRRGLSDGFDFPAVAHGAGQTRAVAYWGGRATRRGARCRSAAARLAREHRARRGDPAVRFRPAVVPLGGRADRVPDVRDHGRRDRHAGGGGGGGDRDRRDDRPRRDVRRPDLGGVDEPDALGRPGDRRREPAIRSGSTSSRRRSVRRSARSPTSSSAATGYSAGFFARIVAPCMPSAASLRELDRDVLETGAAERLPRTRLSRARRRCSRSRSRARRARRARAGPRRRCR